MSTILTNAILCDLDPPRVQLGALRIEDGLITHRGRSVPAGRDDEVIDLGGAVVMPGLVNGHTHLYSALAVGMPPSPKTPRNFLQILKYVWWRLDQALDAESIEMSARIGALEALRCGTTTLIDHHASPCAIDGSLDRIEAGLHAVGLRGVLCYEVTDRHGRAGREAGLAENSRYIDKCREHGRGRFAGLVGAHACFTLGDDALLRLAELSHKTRCGVHIHVAEDPCDEAVCRRKHRKSLIARLDAHGLLHERSLFAHGTHLDAAAIKRIRAAKVTMAHNARSNMNNAVGYAPVAGFGPRVVLGTDGIGSNMLGEARAAWFIARHQKSRLSPADILNMLAHSARRASASLGVTLGKLQPGAAADVILTNYRPFTPIDPDNLAGHLLFALGPQHVESVIIDGRWKLRGGTVRECDEVGTREAAVGIAKRLWERMAGRLSEG